MSSQPYHQQTAGSASALVAIEALLRRVGARLGLDPLQGGCALGAAADDVATP